MRLGRSRFACGKNALNLLKIGRGKFCGVIYFIYMALTTINPDPEEKKEAVNSILALVRSFNLQAINEGMSEHEILGYGPNRFCE